MKTRPEEGTIAIDNSTNPLDPSKGDVYVVNGGGHADYAVVEKFSASGVYLGQVIPPVPADQSSVVDDVAVDLDGGLWVAQGDGDVIEQFNDAAPVNEYVSTFKPSFPPEEESRLEYFWAGRSRARS